MSKFDLKKSTAYFRDGFIPFENASLSIASSPVLYGLSIYTVFNVIYDENEKKLRLFRLREHYDRLVASAKIMDFHDFAGQWPYERFKSTMIELIKKNNLEEDALVRVTVFIDELIAGTRIHDLKNSFSAYVYPMGEILNRNGVHTCVSSWYRTPDNSIPSRAKVNGSYVNASLMKNEAILNGYDEAISIDSDGHVCEGTVANVFMVRWGKLITPGRHADILEGITRDTILNIAQKNGIQIEERTIDRSELYMADELFFSGSSANITPILSVDKRTVGSGAIGEVTKKMIKAYDDARRGNNSDFSSWLTEVN
jgi:branched-chain amino acid aminotransferase